MKKLFLIPLMTLVCSVMAFAADQHVSDIAGLKAAIADASVETIYLDADIQYAESGNSSCINILRSVTIDGQGHTLAGYGRRGTTGNYPTVAINQGGSSLVDVTLKNLEMINPMLRVVETRGNIHSVTIENCHIEALRANNSGYDQPITIGGEQYSQAAITIRNSKVVAPVYYPIVVFNPINLTLENTEIEGWCSVYFKGKDSSAGSRGSVLVANDCHFNAPNIYSGETNAFAMFPLEDDGISITLNNCAMDAEHFGDQPQNILSLSNNAAKTRRTQAVSLTITGDNTYINSTLLNNCWAAGMVSKTDYSAPIPDPFPLSVTISGGTYMFNPSDYYWYKNSQLDEPDKSAEANKGRIVIPDGYEVKTIETQQGEQTTTLYRVRKTISTSESINDNVEGQGDGVNANTEFLISANETVEADATIAHYVEVSNDATLTLPAGKELTVKNGLDVTNGAVLDVKAGSTLIVGEGGVTAESVNSIVVEADENGSASFLLDPEVVVNTTPNITIKMTAKGVGYEMDEEEQEYYWFRFAAPVAGIEAVDKWVVGSDPAVGRPTYFYKWNYAANEWSSISALGELEPFQGFSLTTDHEGLEDIEYTFKGRLAGNQDMDLQFKSRGYNYFGNSYTGYINVLALVEQLMDNNAIDGTVYMWDNEHQKFKDVTLGDLTMADESWKREVAPMQTFILRQVNTGEPTSTTLNYASAIWGNPRYGLVPTPAPAPRRVNNDATKMTIVISAANGKIDDITFKESDEFSDEYNKGFDAVKFMNERQINLYSTINDENLGTVATDNIEGKLINMQTVKAFNYTMSFENVSGEAYAIRDNVTGAVVAIEEGATYEFAAQPNSTVEGRFEIVAAAKVPTAIENTEIKANAKGIYTIMGQYLGEDFNALPAGIYVVNGVKIVK